LGVRHLCGVQEDVRLLGCVHVTNFRKGRIDRLLFSPLQVQGPSSPQTTVYSPHPDGLCGSSENQSHGEYLNHFFLEHHLKGKTRLFLKGKE
jgi:hypothetical protein